MKERLRRDFLAETPREAEAVVRLRRPSAAIHLLGGESASEDALRAHVPKIDSLGLPTGEDGILTAEGIVNPDLRNTELVVLSACERRCHRLSTGDYFAITHAERK
jgi:hypothetical protein